MSLENICVPDIGDTSEVEVIEVLIKEGDTLEVDQTLAVLESDKASMDIPSPSAGVVKKLHLKVGDKVLQGHLIAQVELQGEESAERNEKQEQSAKNPQEQTIHDIVLPDLGTDDKVAIIEIAVQEGSEVKVDQTLLTLESDKASMDVPSEFEGVIQTLNISVGQNAQTGDVIGTICVMSKTQADDKKERTTHKPAENSVEQKTKPQSENSVETPATSTQVYAGPAARKLARDLAIDLSLCQGTGKRGRILTEDVIARAKMLLEDAQAPRSAAPATRKVPDFEKFGAIEKHHLSRIKQKTAQNLQLTVQTVPQVTQFDKADITDLEEFRQLHKKSIADQGGKLTMILFVMKALVATLKKYPQFNSSLSECGTQLIEKKYFHLGVAVDTPSGLVVPVINNVDQKSILDLSKEIVELSQCARQGKLKASQMQGSCMTISSLGGIGGTAFTPIVNWPDVAILGLSASQIEPFFDGKSFVPRTFLPLSLSYDHRVIDGAEAARFIVDLKKNLEDLRRVLFV